MPTILMLFGLKFRIYVRDHQPIHVHVISQEGEAKFQVSDEIKLIDNKKKGGCYESEKNMV